MKLISRKAAIAAITAAAVTAGTLNVPAMAQQTSTNTSTTTTSESKDNFLGGSSDLFGGSSDSSSEPTKEGEKDDSASGSSDLKSKDGRKNFVNSLKEWLTLLTTVGSLLGAVYTIGNNLDRLSRQSR